MRALVLMAAGLATLGAAQPAPAFKLARDDGKGWVEPGRMDGRPAVFLFWDAECAPCLVELSNLAALKSAFLEARFVIVSLSPPDQARRALARYRPASDAIRAVAPTDPRGLFASLGNRRGALPFSAAFRADGTPCHAAVQGLTQAGVVKIASLCRQP